MGNVDCSGSSPESEELIQTQVEPDPNLFIVPSPINNHSPVCGQTVSVFLTW
uniref:Uncharacterized protein n=1 Tax=Arundo donax TaxID=35708 RepID=A0A0A9ASI7_ARUDO